MMQSKASSSKVTQGYKNRIEVWYPSLNEKSLEGFK